MPAQLEVPGWDAWQPVVGRYLAARAFAGWVGYYGSGLLTWYKSVLATYAVLRVSCARAWSAANSGANCLSQGYGAPPKPFAKAEAPPPRALDEAMVVEALGNADRLLIHMASAADLAAALDAWEPQR
jgi:hypothetical protein